MTTETRTYTLNEAYGVLKQNAEIYDWAITGDLPKEPVQFKSQNQRKKFERAVRRACKKGSRRAFNSLLYIISNNNNEKSVKIELGNKEKLIQSKRKTWIELQAKADIALKEYKEEKGNFYKDILEKVKLR